MREAAAQSRSEVPRVRGGSDRSFTRGWSRKNLPLYLLHASRPCVLYARTRAYPTCTSHYGGGTNEWRGSRKKVETDRCVAGRSFARSKVSVRISACDKSSRSNCNVELRVWPHDLVPRESSVPVWRLLMAVDKKIRPDTVRSGWMRLHPRGIHR